MTSIRPKIHIIVLGGTITMMPGSDGGVVPSLTGSDLTGAIPQLGERCELAVETPFLVPGASLTFDHLAMVADLLAGAAQRGADGLVVVQGTDTIDEVAFALDLMLDLAVPVVVTGAMRHPSSAGADGPANLLSSVIVAGSQKVRNCGVLVVLNDQVHLASLVEKSHSTLPSAFCSPAGGPLGEVVENEFHSFWPVRMVRPPLPNDMRRFARVAIMKPGLGDDGTCLDWLSGGDVEGLVIEAMGGGHVPEAWVDRLDELADEVPVLLAKRPHAGMVLTDTYGFKGSERDLINRGLIPVGRLSATKARLLAAALLGSGFSREQVDQVVGCFGSFSERAS
jgi:L-asparaginase